MLTTTTTRKDNNGINIDDNYKSYRLKLIFLPQLSIHIYTYIAKDKIVYAYTGTLSSHTYTQFFKWHMTTVTYIDMDILCTVRFATYWHTYSIIIHRCECPSDMEASQFIRNLGHKTKTRLRRENSMSKYIHRIRDIMYLMWLFFILVVLPLNNLQLWKTFFLLLASYGRWQLSHVPSKPRGLHCHHMVRLLSSMCINLSISEEIDSARSGVQARYVNATRERLWAARSRFSAITFLLLFWMTSIMINKHALPG